MSTITAAIIAPMDMVFGLVMTLPPMLSIVVFSLILSLITLALNNLLMKKGFVKEMKGKQKELQDRMKQAQKEGNKELLSSSMKEMVSMNGKYMKENMKVMVASLAIGIVFLIYMSSKYTGVAITVPYLGFSINWIYWYVITSLLISTAIRKFTGQM